MYRPPPTSAGGGLLCLQLYTVLSALHLAPICGLLLLPHRPNDLLHLFIVSEDASLVPFKVRKQLVMEGTAHLENICYHDSGPYIISNATFPSYFQKDENAVIESHAMLDLTVFTEIARTLGINRRYVGEEPTSLVTGIYNNIMSEKLPGNGIECVIVPRKTDG